MSKCQNTQSDLIYPPPQNVKMSKCQNTQSGLIYPPPPHPEPYPETLCFFHKKHKIPSTEPYPGGLFFEKNTKFRGTVPYPETLLFFEKTHSFGVRNRIPNLCLFLEKTQVSGYGIDIFKNSHSQGGQTIKTASSFNIILGYQFSL